MRGGEDCRGQEEVKVSTGPGLKRVKQRTCDWMHQWKKRLDVLKMYGCGSDGGLGGERKRRKYINIIL